MNDKKDNKNEYSEYELVYTESIFTSLCSCLAALVEYALLCTGHKMIGDKWNDILGFIALVIIVAVGVVGLSYAGTKAEKEEKEALKEWCDIGVLSLIFGTFILLSCFVVDMVRRMMF